MRKLIPILVLGFAAFALAQDGPLTNGANLPVRTDTNGYLLSAAQTYTGPDGPRRVLANTLVRTDANGYLIVTNPTGFGSPLDAQYWVGAANASLTAEKNLGALATALVVNTAGVPSAYAGVSCTNQFLRALSAVGASTCATVSLTADVTGTLPLGNGGTGSTSFTAGSLIFSNGTILTQDNANLFWDDTNNRLGIGTLAPTGRMTVSGNTGTLPAVPIAGTVVHLGGADSGQVSVSLDGFAAAPQMVGRRSQGTAASPSAINFSGFNLFQLAAAGYGASAYSTPVAFLSLQSQEPWTDIAQGTKLILATTGNGTTTATTVMTLSANTGVTIPSFGGAFNLDVQTGINIDSDGLADNARLFIDADAAFQSLIQFQKDNASVAQFDVPGSNTTDLRLSLNQSSSGVMFLGDPHVVIGSASASDGPTTGTNGLIFTDGTALSGMAANTAGLYADDVGGTVKPHAIDEAGNTQRLVTPQTIQFAAVLFASLPTTNGAVSYCSDCQIANPCAGSGTGAIAKRLNGVHVCN